VVGAILILKLTLDAPLGERELLDLPDLTELGFNFDTKDLKNKQTILNFNSV
jgi:hypothetical protein